MFVWWLDQKQKIDLRLERLFTRIRMRIADTITGNPTVTATISPGRGKKIMKT